MKYKLTRENLVHCRSHEFKESTWESPREMIESHSDMNEPQEWFCKDCKLPMRSECCRGDKWRYYFHWLNVCKGVWTS